MPRASRQTELIREPKRKVRGAASTKSTRVGNSLPRHREAVCYEVSPEIRSVREGRIRPGSVAPLLSRRAKALVMKGHYGHHYSDDDEDDDDASDNSDEDSSTEIDYDNELYDHHHHRSYVHHRIPIDVKKDYEEYEDEIASPPSYHIATSLGHTRPPPKSNRTRKLRTRTSRATKSIPTKSIISAATKPAKSACRCNVKNKNKEPGVTSSRVRSGPITRSRGKIHHVSVISISLLLNSSTVFQY
ncbi:unnamed protein product [Litomosoides sigmodontis]|uniref:Uncharacterized protein n=1 Tax=Litomosoides sigmodontis TaxID=42156 RepID=A0A3P6T3I1_LITSI|nr:unnamed protein product [Litomosoides sigmodontis]